VWIYRSAIHRAVERANKATVKEAVAAGTEAPSLLPVWNPGQLRHTAATEIRRKFGAEASQVVLGHAQLATSEICLLSRIRG
jgi:integrase